MASKTRPFFAGGMVAIACFLGAQALLLPACSFPGAATASPQVESRRVHEGAQPGAFQGPGVGLGAQVEAGLAKDAKGTGLRHGSVQGEWRVVHTNAQGQVIVQELWLLTDDGTGVRGTRRYDPDFDPALALTPTRTVEGAWTLTGLRAEWLVELSSPLGAIRMQDEKSFAFTSSTPNSGEAMGTWLGTPQASESPKAVPSTAVKPKMEAPPSPGPSEESLSDSEGSESAAQAAHERARKAVEGP